MLSKLFGFDPSKHNIKTEVMAGITTFLTMAYILAVNPSIFSNLADKGMDTNAVFTATTLAAIIGTLAMAIYAKKPFGLAPGIGLNAFFVFTVCLTMGYSWQFALTAILIEGFIFVVLTLTKVRTLIVDAIPASVKRAIGAGIGLFIAFIGLKNAKHHRREFCHLRHHRHHDRGHSTARRDWHRAHLGARHQERAGLAAHRHPRHSAHRHTDGCHPLLGRGRHTAVGGSAVLPVRVSQHLHARHARSGVHLPLHRHVRHHGHARGRLHQGGHDAEGRTHTGAEQGVYG